jgi:hypothetical protein
LDIGSGAFDPQDEHPDGFVTLTKGIPSTSGEELEQRIFPNIS